MCVCVRVCGCLMCVFIARGPPPRTRATQIGRVHQKHGPRPVAQGPQCPPSQSGPDALSSVRPEGRPRNPETVRVPRGRHRDGRRDGNQRTD